MPLESTILTAVWIAVLIVHASTLIVMHKKRLYDSLPWFYSYTAFHLVRSTLLFVVKESGFYSGYYYLYWGAELIGEGLAFVVIREVFNTVLMPYEGIRRISLLLWKWSLGVLIILAAGYASFSNAGSRMPFISGILAIEQGVHFVQLGLVLFLFLYSAALSLSWRHYSFGLAVGFGLLAAVDLASSASLSFYGWDASGVYGTLKPTAYLAATLVWLGYLWAPTTASKRVQYSSRFEMERWNQAVLTFLNK